MSAAVHARLQCRISGRWVLAGEGLYIAPNVFISLESYAWHNQALELLAANKPPSGCQVCQKSMATLKQEAPDSEPEMVLEAKDGVYQVLCRDCSARYSAKQSRLYKNTAYGQSLKIF